MKNYPDLATFDREGEAQSSSAEWMNVVHSADFVVQGTGRSEILQTGPSARPSPLTGRFRSVIGRGPSSTTTSHCSRTAGTDVTLSSLRGRPGRPHFSSKKSEAPGYANRQACGIRDAYDEFERAGAVVLGVSPDDEGSRLKFGRESDLPFTLLAEHRPCSR